MENEETEMYRYKIYGFTVQTDMRLEEAKECEKVAEPDIKIYKRDLSDISKKIEEHIKNSNEEEKPSLIKRIGLKESILYYADIGIFRITEGKVIEYMAMMDVETPIFRQWLLCMALAIIMIQRKEVAIHGSCIVSKESNKACVISGESGSGKSTLSNILIERGYLFKADDVVSINVSGNGEIWANSAFPARRLCTDVVDNMNYDKMLMQYVVDGGKEKYILDMSDNYCETPKQADVMFVLKVGDYEKVECIEVEGSNKINSIISNLYKRTTYMDMGVTMEVLKKCVLIAKKVKIYEIHRPMGKNTINEIINIIEDVINK